MIHLVMTIFMGIAMSTASAAAENWDGIYRKANGSVVGIGEFHEFGPSHILVDYETGEVGPIVALPDGKTSIGRAIGDTTPSPGRLLERNPVGILLDGQPLKAATLRHRSFEIEHDGVTLAGELVQPKARPTGVLVFVHGSGDGPRRAYDLWTNFFVSRSWAVVVFDKRGSGRSSGDWHDADFITLAGDVHRVLQWTRAQQELAGVPLGLWGASQAGWIIPQLAAKTGEVDFAIVQAGPSTPVDDFVVRAVESELTAYGFPPMEIAKARTYYEIDLAVSRGKRPFKDIDTAYGEAKAAGAEWILNAPDKVGSPERRFIAVIAGFDPSSYWRNVHIPILALFGGKDTLVPVEPNRRTLEALLAEAGNTRAEIVTLSDDNHLNMLARTGVRAEYSTLHRFDPSYFQAMTNFLERVPRRHSR